MPPQSLEKLSRRLSEINCLVRLAKSRRTRRAKNVADEFPAVLRGSVVLLSSHIEGYFEDLVSDIVLSIDEGAKKTSEFPTQMRIRQVLGDPKRWSTEDEAIRWRLVQNARTSQLIQDEVDHTPGNSDPGLHTYGFSNPGTSEIKYLFKTVGISDCWVDFSEIEPRVAYKNEIDAIVSRRNQIAHGNMEAQVTETDINSYVNNFQHTAAVFSDLACAHIRNHIQTFNW